MSVPIPMTAVQNRAAGKHFICISYTVRPHNVPQLVCIWLIQRSGKSNVAAALLCTDRSAAPCDHNPLSQGMGPPPQICIKSVVSDTVPLYFHTVDRFSPLPFLLIAALQWEYQTCSECLILICLDIQIRSVSTHMRVLYSTMQLFWHHALKPPLRLTVVLS